MPVTLMTGKRVPPHFIASLPEGVGVGKNLLKSQSVLCVSHKARHEVLFFSSSLEWFIFFLVMLKELNMDKLQESQGCD